MIEKHGGTHTLTGQTALQRNKELYISEDRKMSSSKDATRKTTTKYQEPCGEMCNSSFRLKACLSFLRKNRINSLSCHGLMRQASSAALSPCLWVLAQSSCLSRCTQVAYNDNGSRAPRRLAASRKVSGARLAASCRFSCD